MILSLIVQIRNKRQISLVPAFTFSETRVYCQECVIYHVEHLRIRSEHLVQIGNLLQELREHSWVA